MMNKKLLLSMSAAAMLLINGCGSSSSSGTPDKNETIADTFKTIAMDATDASKPAKLNLATGALVDDESWHFAYQKYIGFKTNGGTSGTGEMTACVAKSYPALFDADGKAVEAEFKKMTATSTKSDFEAVKSSDCNSSQLVADTITTQIKNGDWLNADYSTGAPVFSASTDSNNSWIIRSAAGDAYARVKVKTVSVVFGAATTRKIVLASEKWNGTTFDEAVDSPELDFSSTKVYWDMDSNTIVAKDDAWELAISVVGRTYPLQVNGGSSGTGKAGIGLVLNGDANTVTDPTNTGQVYKYFGDEAEGAMSGPGGYGPLEYSVGGNHKMWPTFAVYIIKDGNKRYKAQVLSNYGADGSLGSGNLFVRYEEIK